MSEADHYLTLVEQYGAATLATMGRSTIMRTLGLSERVARAVQRYAQGYAAAEGSGTPTAPAPIGGNVSVTSDGADVTVESTRSDRIRTLEGLLTAAQVDLTKHRVVSHKVNTWEQAQAGENGPIVVPLWQVKATLERRVLDEIPASSFPRVTKRPPAPKRSGHCTVYIPDMQVGFRWRDRYTRLEPMHDRRALDVAVQLAAYINPDRGVLLGDNLDLAPWSTKFTRPADVRETTTPSNRETHWWLRNFVQTTGCPWDYLEGNHERRVNEALNAAVPEAAGTLDGDDVPLLSVRRMLGLDELGINYVGPYGEGLWMPGEVFTTHGDVVRSNGTTCHAVIGNATHSWVYGHTHHRELVSRTIHTANGQRTVFAMSPGCLCRTDGAVPSATPRVDWQQGVGVVWYDPDSGTVHPVVVPIIDGVAFYDGRRFEARDRTADIAAHTGYPQIAG